MPIATPPSTMLPVNEILTTALREHDFGNAEPSDRAALAVELLAQLQDPSHVQPYQSSTPPLAICTFRCMLQDTGYPLEVYLPPLIGPDGKEMEEDLTNGRNIDWSRLKERWVGWAVEVPAEQSWAKDTFAGTSSASIPDLSSLSVTDEPHSNALPPSVYGKYPLPSSSNGRCLGAQLKIYDPNASFKPATAYTFTGLLSSAPLPSSGTDEDEEDANDPSSSSSSSRASSTVPTIHVLSTYSEAYPMRSTLIPTSREASRQEVVDYLAEAFEPKDEMAAEVLLAALMGTVVTKRGGGLPVGSFALNLLLPKEGSKGRFEKVSERLREIVPLVLSLPLSLSLLGSTPFYPSTRPATTSATPSSGLQSGLLQLPPSTLLIINEDTLEGGKLEDRGVRNLKALVDVVKDQKLRYEYEFVSEDFGMDTDFGIVVMGMAKSLLPVDFHMPITSSAPTSSSRPTTSPDLPSIRRFLLRSRESTRSFQISDEIAEYIQTEWVRLRKDGLVMEGTDEDGKAMKEKVTVGEEDLKRWMSLGRVLALTYPEATFTQGVWKRTLELDMERRRRLASR